MKRISMYKRIYKNQQGIVSFLTVAFLAGILSLITVGFVRTMISNQRQALDLQLSTQAFYAAESGINNVAEAIESNTFDVTKYNNPNGSCTEAIPGYITNPNINILNTNANVMYTCIKVDNKVENILIGESASEKAETYLIKGATNSVESVYIYWGYDTTETASLYSTSLLPKSNWGTNPAALRISIYYPNNLSNYNRTELITKQRTFFLIPQRSTSGTDTVNVNPDGAITGIKCNLTNGYKCLAKLTMSGFATNYSNGFYIRIAAIYKPTHIMLEGYDSLGDRQMLVGGQTLIDATGRANDVYRRFEVRKNQNTSYDFPDSVVKSGNSLCKQFIVYPGGLYDEADGGCSF